jgi:hypothetical protein
MGLDGIRADEQTCRDFAIREPIADEHGDTPLLGSQLAAACAALLQTFTGCGELGLCPREPERRAGHSECIASCAELNASLQAAAYAAQPFAPAELRPGTLKRAWLEDVELERALELGIECVVVSEQAPTAVNKGLCQRSIEPRRIAVELREDAGRVFTGLGTKLRFDEVDGARSHACRRGVSASDPGRFRRLERYGGCGEISEPELQQTEGGMG